MNETPVETLSVIVEREVPHPPEKIWRALTQPHLIEEWLMKNDFKPQAGHRFNASADWGAVDCEVQRVEPHRTLSYSWDTKDLRSVVTWTLTTRSSKRSPIRPGGLSSSACAAKARRRSGR